LSPVDASLGAYSFLPWVRQGLAAAASAADGATAPARLTLQAVVDVKDGGSSAPVSVRMLGPGDVTGLDRGDGPGAAGARRNSGQIIRREPPPATQTFEPNLFPFVEFDRPDLPWLFTPTKAGTDDRLRPWLVLVAVALGPGVELQPPGSRPLPVLAISAPATASEQLPDLAESWAWAHAQVAGVIPAGSVGAAIAGPQERTLSRLLCPRRLEPQTDYIACVVPAFEVGRLAGLGTPDESPAAKLAPAWSGEAERELPVYDHWEFRTGVAGDFESLVRELRPRPVPRDVGTRALYVGDARGGLPALDRTTPGAVLGLEGALRAPGRGSDSWPATQATVWQTTLEQVLERPEALRAADPAEPLTVAPPIYGRYLAGVREVPDTRPAWVRMLNLDPRHRAAAAAGTAVVQAQQEELMEAAWSQVGRVREANAALRHAQLARATAGRLHARHVVPLEPGTLLALAGPVLRRLRSGATTVARRGKEAAQPAALLDPAFRRLLRPRGPLLRRALPPSERRVVDWLSRLETAAPLVTQRLLPDGTLRLRKVDEVRLMAEGLDDIPGRPGFAILADGQAPPIHPIDRGDDSAEAAAFRDALTDLVRVLDPTRWLDPAASAPLPVSEVAEEVRQRLLPEVTIPARVSGRVTRPPGPRPADPLEPIMAAPELPTPMYAALRELSQDLLLPGGEHLSPNTVTLLESNDAFIEAYMVGLNHEMGRELLWRRYPTDQRATIFRQFWDVGAADPATARDSLYDIPRIDGWDPTAGLGAHTRSEPEGRLVLLLRGELLARYPNAVVTAVKATRTGTGPRRLDTEERLPAFHARMDPDVLLYGFALSRAEALGGTATSPHGWFFVITQPPTEPRFGLDVSEAYGQTPTTWADLSWAHFATSEAALTAMHHLPVTTGPGAAWMIDGRRWGSDAATLAFITLQRPVRIAVHADDMIV
jgi:hypothetical protein